MKIIPSKTQWEKWSLISKVGYISFVLGTVSFILTITIPLLFPSETTEINNEKGNINVINGGQNVINNSTNDFEVIDKTSKEKGAILDCSIEQVAIVQIKQEGHAYNNQFGIILYGIAIVNSSKENLTVKSVKLKLEWNGNHYTGNLMNLTTGIVKDEVHDVSRPSIKLLVPEPKDFDTLVLLDWYNLQTKIQEGKLLRPGEILKGSSFFRLPFKEFSEFNSISSISFEVIDYLGNVNTSFINVNRDAKIPLMYLTLDKFEDGGNED